jgi:hypothetical protein
MKCGSCGAGLPEGARFCPQCAAPAPAAEAETDKVREALAKALGTHYRVLHLLGRGGMGAVYLAHEDGLDRDVAIKVLPPERAGSRETRERFRREARTAARLTHPNVVPLHTFGEADGMMYYVMGYVRGESLAARLRREGRLPEPEARRLLAYVAGALDYAHQQGVVHRDIKPDNILLEEGSGRPLLTDFGIAKAVAGEESLTSTGSVVGTPSYMSPEQASGKGDVDARSDLYSLGVMAYAMLSGRLPFVGKTPAEVIVQHMTRPAEPLVVEGVSKTLTSAVMRCLEKDPARRYARASELVAALRPSEDPDALPDELESFSSDLLFLMLFLSYCWFIALSTMYFALRVPRDVGNRPFLFSPMPFFLALVATLGSLAVLVVGFGPRIRIARRAGYTIREILRVGFLQPRFWQFWYPRALRRPSNVWGRLPPVVRWTRGVWGAALALAALALPWVVLASMFSLDFPRVQANVAGARSLAEGVLAFSVIAAFATAFLAGRSIRNPALERTYQSGNFLLKAPLSASGFWTRPEVTALLTPLPSASDTPATTLPPASTEAQTLER